MSREDLVQYSTLEALAVLERGITTLCSAFNALYFAGYRSGPRRRRVGALVLLVVNLVFLVQSFYFGILPYFTSLDLATLIANPGLRLAADFLPLVASFLITLLILSSCWPDEEISNNWSRTMQTLAVAIGEELWDTVALILLEVVVRVTSQVPSDAVHGLLEALEGLQPERDTHAS